MGLLALDESLNNVSSDFLSIKKMPVLGFCPTWSDILVIGQAFGHMGLATDIL